jgi:DNA-binding response OmpR family regulator
MATHVPAGSFLMLVDDDAHSARLMIRMLLAHGAPSVRWLDQPQAALAEFDTVADQAPELPGLIVVDIKSSSSATPDFVRELRRRWSGARIAAMSASLERTTREALIDAGADAVFERHAEAPAYRREIAAIVSFWVRTQRLEAVGT